MPELPFISVTSLETCALCFERGLRKVDGSCPKAWTDYRHIPQESYVRK